MDHAGETASVLVVED